MALFDFANQQPKTTLQTATPEYTQAVVGNEASAMQKPYQQAAKNLRQTFMSRGLGESGLAGQATADLGQDYLNKLSTSANQAAIKGADIGEERRRAQQTRDWQVQDRDLRYKQLRDEAMRRQDEANRQQWNQLIGTAGSAVGSYFGGSAGGKIGGSLASAGAERMNPPKDYSGDVNTSEEFLGESPELYQ